MHPSDHRRSAPWSWLILPAALALIGPAPALAQQVAPAPPFGGMTYPSLPPRGDWLQVLTVTNRWIVLQNGAGQQFPVALDAIDLFVMRWPFTIDRILPTDLVEVTGFDLGNNQVQTDHVDVFRGAARNLVQVNVQQLVGFNRVVTLYDIERQNNLGINFQYLLSPFEQTMPIRLHVVAPAVSTAPLRLSIGGQNFVNVISGGAYTVTQVTNGVISYVRPGDMAYIVPIAARTNARSLALAQLVVYKGVPLEAFAR